jgi:hypothetical protein
VQQDYLVDVIMTWFEKEYEKATKEIEHYDFNIKKGICEENSNT